MPPLTPEQLKEIMNRTGATPGKGLQFNVQTPGGLIPADINPGQAATITLGGGVAERGQVPAPITTPVTTQTPISGVSGLIANTKINDISQKMSDLSSRISAGLSSSSKTDILNELFRQYGIADQTSMLNQYNQQILEQQQRLKKIPEDLKNTLADVGVSESQLNRLITKESQKPLETLRDLMEQRGVAQDRINQSLNFVRMFSDAATQDQAAKIEALKFELTYDQGIYKNLTDDQKLVASQALEDIKNKLSLVSTLKGADLATIQAVQNAGSYAEAQQIAQPFLQQQASIDKAKDIAPGIAAQIKGMSDRDALRFIQNQAREFNVDVNSLVNAVEAEEAKVKASGSGILSPTEAAAFGVTYGTTKAEVYGKTPQKPATQAQELVASYASRIEQSNPIIAGKEDTLSKMNFASFEAQRRLPSYMQSADFQQFDQAARNFVNATLRRESGAVISPSEFENAYLQYLPRPGDTDTTLKQKAENRQVVLETFKNAAGPAYQSLDELLGRDSSSLMPQVDDDIQQLGKSYQNREALISALSQAYPELKVTDIASRVYSLIPDR